MWLRRSTFLIPPELNSRNPYNRQLSSSSGGHQASSIDDSQVSLGKWTARAFLDPLFSSPPPSSASPTQAASDFSDPLPARILASMLVRVSNDVVVFVAWAVLGFAVHVSTVFTVPYFQPFLPRVLIWIAIVWGCILHYIWPQLRKVSHSTCSSPVYKSSNQYCYFKCLSLGFSLTRGCCLRTLPAHPCH